MFATAAAIIDKPIHLIVGGTHLLPAKPNEIRRIATALRDDWKVAWIAPVHCTGEPAFAGLKESFGDRYLYAGLGTSLQLGAEITVKAEAGPSQTFAMRPEDYRDYRAAVGRATLASLRHQQRRILADARR